MFAHLHWGVVHLLFGENPEMNNAQAHNSHAMCLEHAFRRVSSFALAVLHATDVFRLNLKSLQSHIFGACPTMEAAFVVALRGHLGANGFRKLAQTAYGHVDSQHIQNYV